MKNIFLSRLNHCCKYIGISKVTHNLYRYLKAREQGYKCFRYSLRMRLAVTEAMRDIYYQFSKVKGREIVRLRQALFGEDIEFNVSDSDDTEDD